MPQSESFCEFSAGYDLPEGVTVSSKKHLDTFRADNQGSGLSETR